MPRLSQVIRADPPRSCRVLWLQGPKQATLSLFGHSPTISENDLRQENQLLFLEVSLEVSTGYDGLVWSFSVGCPCWTPVFVGEFALLLMTPQSDRYGDELAQVS